MISLAFIRHGATEGNIKKRYIGRTDEHLCNTGIEQAGKLKNCNLPEEYIFVSPMKRTLQTAQIVFPERKHIIIDDFRETDFGIFEGKTASELSGIEKYRQWVESMCTSPIPYGESIVDFKKRCVEAFCKIIDSLHDDAKASFVVHGGVIMAILEAYAEPKGNFYDYHIENGEFLLGEFKCGKIEIKTR